MCVLCGCIALNLCKSSIENCSHFIWSLQSLLTNLRFCCAGLMRKARSERISRKLLKNSRHSPFRGIRVKILLTLQKPCRISTKALTHFTFRVEYRPTCSTYLRYRVHVVRSPLLREGRDIFVLTAERTQQCANS